MAGVAVASTLTAIATQTFHTFTIVATPKHTRCTLLTSLAIPSLKMIDEKHEENP